MKHVMVVLACLLVGLVFSCGKQATVDDVVQMVTTASGGEEKLTSITDQVSVWDFTMHVMPSMPEPMAEGEMEGEQMEGEQMQAAEQAEEEMGEMGEGQSSEMVITYKKPDKIRFDFQGPDGAAFMSSIYDGSQGWEVMMGQQRELNEMQEQETETMALTWVDGFLNHQEKGLTLELLPNELIDGTKYIVLQSTDKNGAAMKFYVNEATHLIERQAGDMMNMEGTGKEPMYMTLKDYKMMDGVNLASNVALFKENGEMIWEANVKDVRHNTGVDDAMFMPQPMTAK